VIDMKELGLTLMRLTSECRRNKPKKTNPLGEVTV